MWDFKNFSNNAAVITESETLSYLCLSEESEELCAHIDERCLVFCFCDNVVESLLGYVAFLNNRIVPAMLKQDMESNLIKGLYDAYRPRYMWLPEDRAAEFSECRAVYKNRHYLLVRTPFEGPALHDELALLLTTSGSTGSPKFVRQSYTNIISNTKSIVEYLRLTEAERAITTLPMNYTYGISVLNTHLAVGATVLLTNKGLMQKEFWSFFKEQCATSIAGVPYTYEILKRLRITRMELPSLRTMTQAGGKLNPEFHSELAKWAHDTGREFVVMYGQCEATARMAYLPANRSIEKAGYMGIAIPGGRFELVDEMGKVVFEPDVTGELVYYGENVTLGYAESGEDLIKGDERNGRLETGDMAQMDAEGYFRIVGRKKRFLKLFGNRVNLDEAEQLLKTRYQNIECACAGEDDHLKIYTTNKESGSEMCEYLSEKMGLHISAFSAEYLLEIPKNEAGKTLYTELR